MDESTKNLGLTVLMSPPHSPMANAICERLIGTMRREGLDWLIPVSKGHLRWIMKSWVEHCHRGGPHSSLGPGVPDPPEGLVPIRNSESRHPLAAGAPVRAQSVLSGLHHEYLLVPVRA